MRTWRDESGQATAFMALFAGILGLGFLAFALDAGYFFHEKRIAQSAADAAAVAAAEEDAYPGESGNAQAAAEAAATLNGFNTTLAKNPATVTLTSLSSGTYSSSSTTVPTAWVQAVVSKPFPTFFLGAFNRNLSTMTITAMAVAGEGQTSLTCVCLEGSSGQNLNMSNGSSLSASNCGVTADSSGSNAIGIVGGSTLSALTLGTVSTSCDKGSIAASTRVVQGISSSCAPAMPTAPTDSVCSIDPAMLQLGGGANYTVGPGSAYGITQGGNTVCYNSLTVDGNGDTVTLNAGIYVINGGELHFESGTNKGGTGVTFYLMGGASLVIDNGANVNLVAPTSGTYSGVLIYQAASDTQPLSVQGGSSATINGAIYAPGAAITLGNGSGTTVTAQIVAQSLTMNGGGTLKSTPGSNLGTLNISVSRISE